MAQRVPSNVDFTGPSVYLPPDSVNERQGQLKGSMPSPRSHELRQSTLEALLEVTSVVCST